MSDLGPYALYIVSAYGVAALSLGIFLFVTLYDLRVQKKNLSDLEKS